MVRENEADFADFVHQWSPALLRVAYLLTGDATQADPVCALSPHHSRTD